MRAARAIEAQGDLVRAAQEYVRVGARDEATRALLGAVAIEPDPLARYRLLSRAMATANDGLVSTIALRRARLCLDLVKSKRLTLMPSELVDLGAAIEATGEARLAAEAYALSGHAELEASALVSAGAIEELEEALARERRGRTEARAARELAQRIDALSGSGSRRAALALARSSPTFSDVAFAIERRRLLGPRCQLMLDGRALDVVFGSRVTVGRAGMVAISTPSLSKEHVALERSERGVRVTDLGSRNGTWLAGARLTMPAELSLPVSITLGADVPVTLSAHGTGVTLRYLGQEVTLALGPLECGPFRLELSEDGWLELRRTDGGQPALGELWGDAVVQLCRGDQIADALRAQARIVVL
jgi:hypothetical protein